MPAITLEGMTQNGYLAPELSGEIFKKATQNSIVAPLAGTTKMGITGSEYILQTSEPEADIVGESDLKPIDSFAFKTQVVRPIKTALVVYWSKEARMKNPAGIFNNIQEQMSAAIQRQIDYAVLYGKGVKSGAVIPGVKFLNQTTNRVQLDTATTAKGGLTTDFLAGHDLVTEAGYDFTGFAADPRLRSKLMGAVDLQGRPVYQSEVNLNNQFGNLFGLPVTYGKSVSGRVGPNLDTNVRAFGGDFQGNLKLGFVEDISFKMSDQATLIEGGKPVSLWQTNQEAALVEAIFGWVIRDEKAFVAYDQAAAPVGG